MAIPLLIMGAIAAAAAAAGGIANAASTADAAKTNAGEAQKDRMLKEKMQREQLEEAQRQQQKQGMENANSMLQQQYAGAAQKTTAQAAERAATRDDLRGNLSRAYLTRTPRG